MNLRPLAPTAAIRRALSALLIYSFAASLSAQEWTLRTIDGKTQSAALEKIDADGALHSKGGASLPALADLREIHSGKPAPPRLQPTAGVLIELLGGGRIAGASLEMEGEAFKLTLPSDAGQVLQVPLDAAAAIRFQPGAVQPAFEDALARPSPDSDQVLAIIDDQVQPLQGLLSAITADAVEFEFEGQTRKLEKSKVFGVVLARTAAAPPRYHCLILNDGSVLPARSLQFEEGAFLLQAGEATTRLPAYLVQRIELRSDRLIFLSDLEPVRVNEKPLLMLPKRWQRDRAIRGGPILLGGVEYSKGIGCQPRSELTFALPTGAESFLAVVGLDASAKGKGACVFEIRGDGKTLFQQAVAGKQPPVEVALDIRGVSELTLIVEAGEDLDLGDHADWADARVLLKAN